MIFRLSAYMLTLHEMFQWDDIIPCPVDLRRFNLHASNSICNLTGNITVVSSLIKIVPLKKSVVKSLHRCIYNLGLKEPLLLSDHGLPPSIVKEILSKDFCS